jgi:stage II sporulation protein D
MKRTLRGLSLIFVSVFGGAQELTVQVRLFWQHPPSEIRVIPQAVSLRTCAKCSPIPLTEPILIAAKGGQVSTESSSGTRFLLTGRARIIGEGFSPFVVENTLELQAREDFLLLTLKMPLEQYVVAVLQGESAGFRSEEALKAMAVAARTYAVHFRPRHRTEGFDFCDTTHCQDVRLGAESDRVRAAVAATAGELLWYEGQSAATYYHRSCGGEIEDSQALQRDLEAPYLRRHRDEYCVRVPDEWHVQISKSDLSRVFGRLVTSVLIVERSESGRVRKLSVSGRPVTATDFRLAIGRTLGWDKVRSDLYEEQDLGDTVSFRGLGQGHGVGLCQTGGDVMGQAGHNYREILAYYYPGTSIGLNAQGLSWEKLSGESLDLLTTSRADAAVLLPAAEWALNFAKHRTGWSISGRPQVKVYPSISIYRNATGEPGWVAGSTLGTTVRLQPISTLRRSDSLDSILRHEFLHMLIEANAAPTAPIWLREGLAIYLANPHAMRPANIDVGVLERQMSALRSEEEMRAAYRACGAAVANAVEKSGLDSVLSWVRNGR